MRGWLLTMLCLTWYASAGGATQQPSGQEAEKEARETMRRMRAGEKIEKTDSGLSPCEILREAKLAELFAVEAAAIQYTASSTRHPLCGATWRRPGADQTQAELTRQIMDYMKRQTEAKRKGQPFDEKMPIARTDNSVSLTIVNESFANAGQAVASLESVVARMTKGMTVEIQGKNHTTQIDYEDWLPGVGDQAAWAPKLSQLSVAAKGVVFHLAVKVSDDAAQNRTRAIELARKVAAGL